MRFFNWLKMKPEEPRAVAAPLAKTIPDDWKQPIADVTAPNLRIIEANIADIQRQIDALKPATITVQPEVTLKALADSRNPNNTITALGRGPVGNPAPIKRAPIFATGDLSGENIVKLMR